MSYYETERDNAIIGSLKEIAYELRQIKGSLPYQGDAVEVVRCYDCKHCEQVEDSISHVWSCFCVRFRHTREVDVSDYCSYGERREV